MYDMIVIGGGPAALSAMYYAHSKRLKVVMLCESVGGKVDWVQRHAAVDDQLPVPGTELVRPLINWMSRQMNYVIKDRVHSVTEGPNCFEVATDDHGILNSATVIVATGASPQYLHVPGAASLLDHGLHYSIATHAFRTSGKSVAVVGVTPRSLRGTAELARTADQVYLIAESATMLANPIGRGLRQQPHVEVLENYTVNEVIGLHNVEALIIESLGQARSLNVQQVFVDLGLVPNSAFVHSLVATDAGGFIRVDQHNATSIPGIYAAGDVTTSMGEQMAIALGDGARAAQGAYDYVLALDLATRVGHSYAKGETRRRVNCD